MSTPDHRRFPHTARSAPLSAGPASPIAGSARSAPWCSSVLLCAFLLASCNHEAAPEPTGPNHTGAPTCPARTPADALLPGTSAEQNTLAYWLTRYTQSELDEPLLDADEIAQYDATIGRRPGHALYSQQDLSVAADPLVLAGDVRERIRQLLPQVTRGELVDREGRTLLPAQRAGFVETLPALAPSLQVVLEPTPLRCGPFDGALYKSPIEPAYDKNACGTLRPQELIELLGRTDQGLVLARSRYSLGWLAGNAQLSPVVPAALVG
ncbi:MAG TPA: hypothetical protein VF331_04150, partial [Polyangiales bacterium]